MKVVHLRLFEPLDGETEYFFGSLKAIYSNAALAERVRIRYTSLTNAMHGKTEYRNKTCIITIGHLQTKKQTKERDKV